MSRKLIQFSHKIDYKNGVPPDGNGEVPPQFVFKIPLPEAFYRQEGPKWIHVRNVRWLHCPNQNSIVATDVLSVHADFNSSPASYDHYICMTNIPPSHDMKFEIETKMRFFNIWFIAESIPGVEEWVSVGEDDSVIIELELEF